VRDLVFGRDRFCLRGGKSRTAWLGEVAERYQREAMTSLADFAVDLEAALQLCLVVHAERPGERPFYPRWRLRFLGARRPRTQHHERTGQRHGEDAAHSA